MEAFISQDQLIDLLRQSLGARLEILDCQVANRQHDYQVLLLRLRRPTRQVVIKLAGPEAIMASSFDRTAMLHRLVAAKTALPVPEILALDLSCRDWPWRYLITRYIPGQEWAAVRGQLSTDELSSVYWQIGYAVAQLHTIHFPAFGELAADGSQQGSVPGTGAYFPALAQRARASIRSDRWREAFAELLDRGRQLFEYVYPPSLCHEDLHQHNLLFQYKRGKWRLSAMLDFDKAWAGHAEIDLARLELWQGMTGDTFWQAYRPICPVSVQYPQRRPIYQLLWCLEYARNSAEHLVDTQRLCTQLGLPRIERFDL